MILKNPRNLLWLVPVALFITSPLWKPALSAFLKPRGGIDPSTKINFDQKPEQSFIMDTITITMSDYGREKWIVNAKQAFTLKSDQEIGMTGVDALYTDEDSNKTNIISDEGMYYVDMRHLVLIDNVIIRKPSENEEMFTDLLHYYDDRKMAVSPGDVEIKGKDYTIEAGRMDYNLATNAYDFSNGVKVDL